MSKKTPRETLENIKVRKPNPIINRLLRIVLFFITRKMNINYKYEFEKKEMKNKQVILIGNHATRNSFMYILRGYPFTKLNPVVGYRNFFQKPLFKPLLWMGCIPKRLFVPDVKATVNMLKVLKSGGSLLLFPEGIQSTSGSTMPMNPATIKFFKKSPCDIIIAISKGEFMFNPRFSNIKRCGNVDITYKVLFTKEEIETLTENEMYERYLKEFSYDDFNMNLETRWRYKGKCSNAEGLDNIIYKCPNCNQEFKMHVLDDSISCECGNSIKVNEYYDLIPNDNSKMPFKSISDWVNYQRNEIKKEIEKEDFKFEYNVTLRQLDETKLKKNRYDYKGEGTVTIDRNNLTYKGTRDDKDVIEVLDLKNIPSATFKPQTGNEFFYLKNHYSLMPKDDQRYNIKVALLTEELYFTKNPAWNEQAEKVFK